MVAWQGDGVPLRKKVSVFFCHPLLNLGLLAKGFGLGCIIESREDPLHAGDCRRDGHDGCTSPTSPEEYGGRAIDKCIHDTSELTGSDRSPVALNPTD